MPVTTKEKAVTPTTAPVRVVMLGHVDHGKSTFVGRLMHDTGSLPEGKLEQIRKISEKRGLEFEFAFALDALQAERDQGITIDAAHVWMHVNGRPFVIIDAPGHEEFLKNMITGASTADAALVLVDAREGIREQSRRHALLLRLLGLHQVAVLVNKMDLVGWSEQTFRDIEKEYGAYLKATGAGKSVFIPISAKAGANVVARATDMPWYTGPTVAEAMHGFKSRVPITDGPLRFPIQDVYRQNETTRIFAGRIESGTLRVGDQLVFSPWNKTGFVKTIERWSAPPVTEAHAGDSVGITLDAQLFVERGQIASHLENAPVEADRFDARLFWLGKQDLMPGKEYLLKITSQEVICRVVKIHQVVDVATLGAVEAQSVARNQIAEVTIETQRPIAIDDFGGVPQLGRFVLHAGARIEGGGIISTAATKDLRSELSGVKSHNISFVSGQVSRDERARRTGHHGRVLWFTGLSGSGKSTLAVALERRLFDAGYQTYLLDGDNLRHGLNANLGFSEEDRAENVRRVGEVAKLFGDSGLIVLVALISPMKADRDRVRGGLRQGEFVEVFVDCPLAVCEERDPKGIYKKARAGQVKSVTGIDAPYEAPEKADLVVRTDKADVDACVAQIMAHFRRLEAEQAT